MPAKRGVAILSIFLLLGPFVQPAFSQDVDYQTALVWSQFVVGPVGDDSDFEVELVISNTHPTNSYSGELLAANQEYNLIEGIEVQAEGDGAFLQKKGTRPASGAARGQIRPAFTEVGLISLAPLESVKLRIFAGALLTSLAIGFLILNCTSGSNDYVVATAAYKQILNGVVINSVPLLPVVAALGFYTTLCLTSGVNTGLAIVSLLGLALVEVIVHARAGTSSLDAGGREQLASYSDTLEVFGQQAKFPNEIIENLPNSIPGGLIEIRSELPIWVMALDVTQPPASAEVGYAAKLVKPVENGAQ
jgi:hypothetical protein